MTQEELGFAASVSPRTIRNIERGVVTGQADVLSRLFAALDVPLSGSSLRGATQQWLAVIGPMLDALPDAQQTAAVQKILPLLVDAVRAPKGFEQWRADVVRMSEDQSQVVDVDELRRSGFALAAGHDDSTDEEDDVTP